MSGNVQQFINQNQNADSKYYEESDCVKGLSVNTSGSFYFLSKKRGRRVVTSENVLLEKTNLRNIGLTFFDSSPDIYLPLLF